MSIDLFLLYESLGYDFFRLRAGFLILKTFSYYKKQLIFGSNSRSTGIDILISNFNWNLFFLKFFKKSLFYQTNQFIDLIAIDRLKRIRFRLVYAIKSVLYNQYLFLHFLIPEKQMLESGIKIFLGLNWSEREVWDMFGIFFLNNSDLRRILTDYGFRGYPLRKDFPLSGFKELIYSELLKLLQYKKVSLMQEYRDFYLPNPWGPYPKKYKLNY
jgi:NADH-quinone oxidoreductase subunit C